MPDYQEGVNDRDCPTFCPLHPRCTPRAIQWATRGRTTWRSWFIADEELILRLWKHIPQPLGGDVCRRRGTYGAEQLDILLDDVGVWRGASGGQRGQVTRLPRHILLFHRRWRG